MAKAKRVCDLCEQEPVELFFGDYDEFREFQQYGNLPHVLSLLFQICQVKNGAHFYLPGLKLNIVICDKCLSQNLDITMAGKKLIEKPHLLKEAIDHLNRHIKEEQESLMFAKARVMLLRTEISRTGEEITKQHISLKEDWQLLCSLEQKNKDIRAARRQVVIILKKIADQKSA